MIHLYHGSTGDITLDQFLENLKYIKGVTYQYYFGTERALTSLVGKRRSMLDYLKSKDIERYRAIIKELGIRK